MQGQTDIGVIHLEPDAARRIYNAATDYDFCWAALHDLFIMRAKTTDSTRTTMPYLLPTIMLSSFCCELYLKCLLTILKVEYPGKHEFVVLFGKLPPEIQSEITDNHNTPAEDDYCRKPANDISGVPYPSDYYTIPSLLARVNRSFVDWRYLYECKLGLEYSGIDELRHAVVKCILRLRPEWPHVIQRHGAPPTFLTH